MWLVVCWGIYLSSIVSRVAGVTKLGNVVLTGEIEPISLAFLANVFHHLGYLMASPCGCIPLCAVSYPKGHLYYYFHSLLWNYCKPFKAYNYVQTGNYLIPSVGRFNNHRAHIFTGSWSWPPVSWEVLEMWKIVPTLGIEPTYLVFQAGVLTITSPRFVDLTITYICGYLPERSVETTTLAYSSLPRFDAGIKPGLFSWWHNPASYGEMLTLKVQVTWTLPPLWAVICAWH